VHLSEVFLNSQLGPTPAFEAFALTPIAGGWGGNPSGKSWFFGIESGGPFVTPSPDCAERYDHWESEGDPVKFTWPFTRNVAKVAAAANGGVLDWRTYQRSRLFVSAGETCHFNLFPLNFPRLREWAEAATHFSGFPDKKRYQDWCREFRFPVLRTFAERLRPSVIVCAGGSYAPLFKEAFLGSGRALETGKTIPLRTLRAGTNEPKSFEQYQLNESTSLLLTPFFGQGGLLANADFEALGQHIARVQGGV
jgi:hypothetical protein